MNKRSRYSPEVRERAVRKVFDHEHDYPPLWAAIQSIAGKIGCTAETLRVWVHKRYDSKRILIPRAMPIAGECSRIGTCAGPVFAEQTSPLVD